MVASGKGLLLLGMAALCAAALLATCSAGAPGAVARGPALRAGAARGRVEVVTGVSASVHAVPSLSNLALRGGMGKHGSRRGRHEDSDAMSVEEEEEGHSSSSESESEGGREASPPRRSGHRSSRRREESVSEEDSRSASEVSRSGSGSDSHSHSHSEESEGDSRSGEEESSSSEESRGHARRRHDRGMKDDNEESESHSHSHDHGEEHSHSESEIGDTHSHDHGEHSHSGHTDEEEEGSHSHSGDDESGSASRSDADSRSAYSSQEGDEEGSVESGESRDDDDDMYADEDRILPPGPRLALGGGESRELATMGEGRELSENLAGTSYYVRRHDHADHLLAGVEALRRRSADGGKSFCDVTLDASGAQQHAHRAVLAAVSPELETLMGTASKAGVVKLPGVDAHGLSGALAFVYNGTVEIPNADLPSVFKAADVLNIRPLKDACIEHMLAELTPMNALKYRAMGASLPCVELAEAAHNMVMEEFPHVSRSTEFLELGQDHLEEVLSSEDLLVSSEVEVLEAVLRWVSHDTTNRTPSLLRLLSHVRLGLMTSDGLAKRVASAPLIQQTLGANQDWSQMLKAAITYVGSTPDERKTMSAPQTRPRLGSKGRYVFCVGGRKGSSSKAQKRVWMLDKLNYDWFEVESMMHSRKQLAAAELDGRVYAAGGWDGDQYLRSVERFSPLEDCWERVALMGTARGSFGLVSIGGALVAAGGFDGRTHLNSVEIYNATSNTWIAGPPLNIGRSGLKLVELGGLLYAIGGFDGSSVLSSMERLEGGLWVPCAPMSEARRDMGVTIDNGKIVVTGGFNGEKDLASAERYDPLSDSWTPLKPMNKPRSGHGLASVKGKVHAIGGYDGVRYLSQAEALAGDSWEESLDASLPVRMAHFALTVV